MADVDNGDILRLGAGLIYDGLYDVVNVWHTLCTLTEGKTWAGMVEWIQLYMNNIYDEIKSQLSEEIGTGAISVANATQKTTLGSILWSPTWAGTGGADQTAAGVCCFTWGRTYKPRVQIRKYFGVFADADIVTGSWVTAVTDDCKAAMDYHIQPRVLHATVTLTGVAYNRTLETYEFAHSVDASAEPAYQRRRKRGRGS